MIDIATRITPTTIGATAQLGVPFDWRLATPTAPIPHPYTDVNHPSGALQPGVELLASYALELEDSLQTAIILSLFTDRRAGQDDRLPLGETDRRGWVGDEFMGSGFNRGSDAWGSGLWLVYTGKVTGDMLEHARFAAQESLDWLVRDGIASRVTVTAQWVGDRLAVRPTIYQPERVQPVYDVLWGTSISRWATT